MNGKIIHRCGIKVLDGTEDWRKSSSKAFYLSDNIIDYSKTPFIPFCTHFKGQQSVSQGSLQVMDLSTAFYAGTINEFYVRYSAITTVEQFKSWLADQYNAGTPVTIVYPLAESTTETVTAQPMNIQAGTNIVEITQSAIDNLGLEVSYKATV